MQPKIDVFLFCFCLVVFIFFFVRSLYSIYLICFFFLFLFWTVCQIDCGFLFGHRDRSETHPAYLPTFSVKLSFMRISIYSLYTYYIFFSFYSMYNEWLASMYVCMLFYSRCGKIYIYKKKERKQIKGMGCFIVVLMYCSHSFFF
jgi:SNF family Na+-dependent transporter